MEEGGKMAPKFKFSNPILISIKMIPNMAHIIKLIQNTRDIIDSTTKEKSSKGVEHTYSSQYSHLISYYKNENHDLISIASTKLTNKKTEKNEY